MKISIDDIQIGDQLEETDKYKNQCEQSYRENGFYKGDYVIYDDVKHYVTDKTTNSVEVFCGKKTNKGVDAKQWVSMREFVYRFKLKDGY